MNCPLCQIKIGKVYTSTKYRTTLEFDQCQKCGGLWFDDFEMYTVPEEKARKIDRVNKKRLYQLNQIRNELKCPCCQKKLKVFSDPNFPKTLVVEYCPSCFGFWLDRGELLQVKDYQKKKRAASKETDKLFDYQIDRLINMQKSQNYAGLGFWGRVLSTKLDRQTLMPLENKTRADQVAGNVAGVVGQVITTLIRLFVR